MKKWKWSIPVAMMLLIVALTGCGKSVELVQFNEPAEDQPIVTMTIRDYGDIKLMLFPDEAPKTVENFIGLAEQGYYDGVTFHRVIDDFMIQGGDPTATGAGGHSLWNSPFEDEFSNNLYHFRGALSMANSGANSNGSQFFIVQGTEVTDDTFENAISYHKQQNRGLTSFDKTVKEKYAEVGGQPSLDGMHTVFGQVIDGMDVVDAIAATDVDDDDKPLNRVVIEKVTVEQ